MSPGTGVFLCAGRDWTPPTATASESWRGGSLAILSLGLSAQPLYSAGFCSPVTGLSCPFRSSHGAPLMAGTGCPPFLGAGLAWACCCAASPNTAAFVSCCGGAPRAASRIVSCLGWFSPAPPSPGFECPLLAMFFLGASHPVLSPRCVFAMAPRMFFSLCPIPSASGCCGGGT